MMTGAAELARTPSSGNTDGILSESMGSSQHVARRRFVASVEEWWGFAATGTVGEGPQPCRAFYGTSRGEVTGDPNRPPTARSLARAAPRDLVGMDPKQRLAMRRRVAWRERVRIGGSKNGHRRVVLGAVLVARIGLEKVDRAVHDHALPIEAAAHFVDPQRDPRMLVP